MVRLEPYGLGVIVQRAAQVAFSAARIASEAEARRLSGSTHSAVTLRVPFQAGFLGARWSQTRIFR
jgi:hypothetical protein